MSGRTDLTEDQFKEVIKVLNVLSDDPTDYDWLVDATEKWCQERAIYLSLMESVKIADGQDSKRDKGAIPQILSEALGVSFDQHVGHDYVSDAKRVMISTIAKKIRSRSTSHSSIRLRRVVYRTKLLTSHSLVLVWASLCLCVTCAACDPSSR